jgi:hypothetical protein
MKTISISIPDHLTEEEFKNRLEMISSRDWIASWWHIEDITSCCDWHDLDITDDDAREVLRLADKYHDSEQGLNWHVLQYWVDHVAQQRKKAA